MPLALAIGLGFGIGEIWFIAHAAASAPNYPDLPFWMFYGFVIERLEVCFLHGAFIALAVAGLALGRSFWPGALAGVALHFVANFPLYLAQINLFALGRPLWSLLLMAWILGLVILGVALTWRLHRWLKAQPAPNLATAPQ
jgi:hypothetical protein